MNAPCRPIRLCAIGLASGLLAAVPARAATSLQATAQEVRCSVCHANRDFMAGRAATPDLEARLLVTDSILADSRHRGLACGICHPEKTEGYPHRAAPPLRCDACHTAEGAVWRTSIHAAGTGDSPTCVTCHGAHHVLGADDERSPIYPLNEVRLCAGCHADPEIIGHYFDEPDAAPARTAVARYQQTVHGTALSAAGLIVSATCSDCHRAHAILPSDSVGSSVHRDNIPATCGACHAGIQRVYDRSAHGVALHAGDSTSNRLAPVCTDCHTSHDIVRADEPAWFIGVVDECGKCHAQLYETYLETYHGKVTQLGFGLTAKCSDCHTAHDMRSASDPESSVFPANLVATCGQCHAGANARFVQYYAHGDPRDRQRYPSLFWPWLFMTLLLAGVFGVFGLHTLLWLNRVAIERLRRRQPEEQGGLRREEASSGSTGRDHGGEP